MVFLWKIETLAQKQHLSSRIRGASVGMPWFWQGERLRGLLCGRFCRLSRLSTGDEECERNLGVCRWRIGPWRCFDGWSGCGQVLISKCFDSA